jgi:hypothetical protein
MAEQDIPNDATKAEESPRYGYMLYSGAEYKQQNMPFCVMETVPSLFHLYEFKMHIK